MSPVLNAINLIVNTPSYYFFLLLTLVGSLAIAIDHRQRGSALYAARFAIVLGLVLGLHLSFGILASLATSLIASTYLFETAASLISLGLLIWVFSQRLNNLGLLGFVIVAGHAMVIIFALVLASVGPTVLIGQTLYGWLVVLAILAILAVWRQAYLTAKLGFLVLAIAAGGQILFFSPDLPPGIFRLGQLIAYLLLGAAVYQEMISTYLHSNRNLETLSEDAQAQAHSLMKLFAATEQVSASLELSKVLDNATRGIVQTLQVDQCAIIMPEEEAPQQMRMVSVHNPHNTGRTEALTFPLREQTALKHAMENRVPISLPLQKVDNPGIAFLFAMMGARGEVGPLIIHPLVERGQAIGALLVGNAQSKRAFGHTDASFIASIAGQIAIAVANARTHRTEAMKAQQLAWTLRNQEQEMERNRAALLAEVNKSRESVALISQRLKERDALARQSQKELTGAQQQLVQLNRRLKEAQETIQGLETEKAQLERQTGDAQVPQDALLAAEAEAAQLREKVQQLELEVGQMQELSRALEAAQERSRTLNRALQRSRAKMQQQAQMPASLTGPQANPELEGLSFGVVISDEHQTITRINAATAQLLRLNKDSDLIGQPLSSLSKNQDWQAAVEAATENQNAPIPATLRQGQQIIKVTISPIPAPENQKVNGHLVILYDATKEFETQQARDEFVASLSQEVRTPMTSISGYVDLLLDESVGTISEMQRKFLQRVKANIERMNSMLNDLIGVTAIDAGQLEIKPIRLDMAEVIEDAILGAKAQIQEKDIDLYIELPEQVPPVEADPDSMRQVLTNLLGNATKSTPAGGKVMVRTTVVDGIAPPKAGSESEAEQNEEIRWLHVSVTDSGGGIAPQDQERVFERFYQAERPLIQGLGETGVGLSIVKYLVEAHNGRVWLDTELGQGSTFHFTLPIVDYFGDPWEELDVPPLDLNSDIQES